MPNFDAAMKKILKVDTPNVFARQVLAPELHPLVSIIHFDELPPIHSSLNNYGVYGLFIQKEFPKNLSYGMKTIQASDASVIAVAPGQIGGMEDTGEELRLSGWVLLWSPDLLHGTELEAKMGSYQYFSYFATESLLLEPAEWDSIERLLTLMREELQGHADSPVLRDILLGYLHLILEYCQRSYLRQLSQEDRGGDDLLKRMHRLLEQYFLEGKQYENGLPSVRYLATELAYSPHYFGDLVHQATGGTAISYIHTFILNKAKSLLMNGYNVSETAHLLGFDYSQHFTRLFKRLAGVSPTDFLGK